MRTITVRQIQGALEQARGVGLVEEDFTLLGEKGEECKLVVRNLRPDEYEAVMADCEGVDGMAYLNIFQKGHVCRALVELNGFDLRDVSFVEDEIPDPEKTNAKKKVRYELHKWLEETVLSTWSKEALFTAYRKVTDAVAKAEAQSKEGVTFLVPEEAPYDRIRQLMAEVKDLEGEVAPEVLTHIYDDFGLIKKASPQSYQAASDRLENLPAESPELASVEPSPGPLVAPQRQVLAAPAPSPSEESLPPPTPSDDVLRRRVPLNQMPVEIPRVASPTEEMLPPIRRKDQAVLQKDDLGLGQGVLPESAVRPSVGTEVAMLGPQPKFDPKAALQIIDQPPPAGINSRFRPPGR